MYMHIYIHEMLTGNALYLKYCIMVLYIMKPQVLCLINKLYKTKSYLLIIMHVYRIFSKNSSHLVSQKFRLMTEFRVVFPPLRMADETLELSDEYLEN